jgi:predicted DNA-binding protein YlxM (UPF0122 family)
MPTKKKTSYTIAEAANKLGISRQAVHEAISTGITVGILFPAGDQHVRR